jgi:hypothetical protein
MTVQRARFEQAKIGRRWPLATQAKSIETSPEPDLRH